MARESKSKKWNWKLLAGIALFAAAGASTAMAGLQLRQYLATDPRFYLSRETKGAFQIEGVRYASRSKILRVFAPDFDHSIFSTSLAERRRKLLAIDWVEDASISRIWPDRLIVRVRERQPVAFVSLRAGVLLIDRTGVLLDPPAQAVFTFPVLSGIGEGDSAQVRRERVRTFLDFQADMSYQAKDVSEVDATDPDNVRIVAQVGNRALELLMGDRNFGRRYQNFLTHYPEIQKRSPEGKVFDLRLDDRITAKD